MTTPPGDVTPVVTGIEIQTQAARPQSKNMSKKTSIPISQRSRYAANKSSRKDKSDVVTQANVGTDPLPSEQDLTSSEDGLDEPLPVSGGEESIPAVS